ncbi:flagellar assembly protein FliW [Arthrobacter sp.]|uniref:flagellar assembly protein FliW n=1 Tax=Arthrobacter sp. TaxID=1667 RepID=UPI0028A14DB0|nr:flagellar assembly protein FliW [Arthrobacter sp.]
MSTVTPVRFLAPPPGLEPLTAFDLVDVEGASGLYSLTGTESSGGKRRFYAIDASVYLPDYNPEISDEQARQLGLEDPADARVLVVANPSDGGTTVNLLAPVIVNTRTWQCAQVILEGGDWPLRAPLEAAAAA